MKIVFTIIKEKRRGWRDILKELTKGGERNETNQIKKTKQKDGGKVGENPRVYPF